MWCVASVCTVLLVLVRTSAAILDDGRSKRTVVGYYPLCPRGCASCSSVNGCVTCRDDFYLYLRRDGIRQTGHCVKTCPAGYYGTKTGSYAKCYKCASMECEACFSRSYCTRCKAPYLAYRGDCVEHCPAGLHYAQYLKDCKEQVDCALSPWSDWGNCLRNGQSCGYKWGLQTRSREVLQLPSPTGAQCPSTTDTRRCRLTFRYCVDLENNNSEPAKVSVTKKRKGKDKKNQRRRENRIRRRKRKKERARRRKQKLLARAHRKWKSELPDVSTNEIHALLSV